MCLVVLPLFFFLLFGRVNSWDTLWLLLLWLLLLWLCWSGDIMIVAVVVIVWAESIFRGRGGGGEGRDFVLGLGLLLGRKFELELS